MLFQGWRNKPTTNTHTRARTHMFTHVRTRKCSLCLLIGSSCQDKSWGRWNETGTTYCHSRGQEPKAITACPVPTTSGQVRGGTGTILAQGGSWGRVEPETHTCVERTILQVIRERMSPAVNSTELIGYSSGKNLKDLYLLAHTKINSKWIKAKFLKFQKIVETLSHSE